MNDIRTWDWGLSRHSWRSAHFGRRPSCSPCWRHRQTGRLRHPSDQAFACASLTKPLGFLTGKRATTHPGAYKELEPYCATVVQQRIVDEGALVTGGGVSTSIDLGLHIVERLVGKDARTRVAKQMDYPYG